MIMGIDEVVQLFAVLLVAHAIADYPLQGEFLAKAKNRFDPIPGVPWYQALGAHALIHAGAVGWATGSVTLGAAEWVCHGLIDDLKCGRRIGYNIDQLLHVVCKVIWVGVIYFCGPLP